MILKAGLQTALKKCKAVYWFTLLRRLISVAFYFEATKEHHAFNEELFFGIMGHGHHALVAETAKNGDYL